MLRLSASVRRSTTTNIKVIGHGRGVADRDGQSTGGGADAFSCASPAN